MHVHVTIPGGDCPRTFEFKGRLGWTIAKLSVAGPRGVSTLTYPAPRLSAYVHTLRRCGIPIETELVRHGGTYAGRHAVYRLGCTATIHTASQADRT